MLRHLSSSGDGGFKDISVETGLIVKDPLALWGLEQVVSPRVLSDPIFPHFAIYSTSSSLQAVKWASSEQSHFK